MPNYEVKKLSDVAEYKVECEIEDWVLATSAMLQQARDDGEVPHCITFDFPEVHGKWYIVLTC